MSDEEELERHANAMVQVDAKLRTWIHQNKGKAAKTKVGCPLCGKMIHVAKVASNNHTRGACETPDCIKWIQ